MFFASHVKTELSGLIFFVLFMQMHLAFGKALNAAG